MERTITLDLSTAEALRVLAALRDREASLRKQGATYAADSYTALEARLLDAVPDETDATS